MRNLQFATLAVAALLIACGGDGSSTPTPPPPPTAVATVSVTPTSAEIVVGATRQLAAQPKDAGGNNLSRTVTWTTSSAAVATVNSAGLVTAVSVGNAQITATSEGKSANVAVSVTPAVIAVATVAVAPGNPQIEVGGTTQLAATVRDADGNTLTGRAVQWSSASASIATVSASGLVTAVTPGVTQVTATSEGKSGQATVTVTAIPVTSVTVGPATSALAIGETVQLTATARSTGDQVLTDRTVTWLSSNPAVATVNASGLVTAVASGGPINVTATIEGKSASAAITVTSSNAFVQVVTGYYHTCALNSEGQAWCWGLNDDAQTGAAGPGTPVPTPLPVMTEVRFQQLALSWGSTCGLDLTGKVWCWGEDNDSSIGDGTKDLWPTPTPLRGDFTFTSITGGDDSYCGITPQQAARCWGDGDDGELGQGEWGDAAIPVLVAGGHQWQSIARGTYFTCGLTTAGKPYCWGTGSEGQLGIPDPLWTHTPIAVIGGHTFVQLTAGEWHVCGRTAAGEAWCWGYNGEGQLGDGTTTDRSMPTKVAGGDAFTSILASGWNSCGLLASGQAKCWGDNETGTVGDGTTTGRTMPTPVGGGQLFTRLAEGIGYHACGFRGDGVVMCWGWNEYSQLGNGQTADALLPIVLTVPTLDGVQTALTVKRGSSIRTPAFVESNRGRRPRP